ncbi:MAG: clostripain-related cysteine peptidase [Oscillospiraceae bacterium]|nr:clostripain-related cysteine peptidase [Oscillospiraceae bacterium]MDY2848469.1 clostripain-related cysteine peptidase [Oscillospiraceae bacterium]
MNIFKKLVSAVSAAVLAVTALTSVYTPSVSAEEYTSAGITQEYSAESELADMYASSSKAGFTLMVYMVGSNLESDGGLATDDIEEICNGYSGKNVNIIIQTGGTVRWYYDGISSKKCQRFKVESYGLELVDNSVGMQNMSSKNTLGNFIRYCKKNYPASRYGLVLWDHGGGTVGGFGMDQVYSYESMSLEDYNAALKKGGVHFDFVGFDACLMATLETALMTSGYADHLIASEDSVSGIGWYYTDWIKSLCNNPKLSTTKLGKKIVDSTVKESALQGSYNNSDISVIDLSRIKQYVIPALNTFSQKSISLLKSKKYHIIAKSRSGLSIYDSYTELVDIADYASCFSDNSTLSKSAASLKTAVKKAVIYHKSTGSPVGSGGLSIAFPFDDLENLDTVINIYDTAGVKTSYTKFLNYFANIMAGGQQYYLGASKARDYSDCGWYDESKFYSDSYYKKFYLDDDDLEVKKINGRWVCPITDDQSATISRYELCMYYYNEDAGYAIDFGTDNIYDFDSKGRLIVEYNETWVSLNGTPIPCYYIETTTDDGYTTHISCTYGEYNGLYARIYLMWDNDRYTYPDNGTIMAWSPLDDQGRASRLISAEKGDTFKIYYDVYDENIEYQDSILADDYVYTVGKTRVTYEDVSYLGMTVIYYRITDIFNNVHFTENIYYYTE